MTSSVSQRAVLNKKVHSIFTQNKRLNDASPPSDIRRASRRAPWRLIDLDYLALFHSRMGCSCRDIYTRIWHRLSHHIWIHFCKYCITLKVMASSLFLFFPLGHFWDWCFQKQFEFIESSLAFLLPCVCVLFNVHSVSGIMLVFFIFYCHYDIIFYSCEINFISLNCRRSSVLPFRVGFEIPIKVYCFEEFRLIDNTVVENCP